MKRRRILLSDRLIACFPHAQRLRRPIPLSVQRRTIFMLDARAVSGCVRRLWQVLAEIQRIPVPGWSRKDDQLADTRVL